MGEVSLEAGHRPAVVPRHRGAKAPGGAKRPGTKTVRCQLHLGEQTQTRLAVHAALVRRNASRVADEILSSWLKRFGQGRANFPEEESLPADADPNDRLEGATLERKSEAEPEAPGGATGAAGTPPPEPPSARRPGRRRNRHKKRGRGEAGRSVEGPEAEGVATGPEAEAEEVAA
jgi:hypothetical protein